MIVTVGNDGQFASFCRVMGRPQWASDERFATNAKRQHTAEVLRGWLAMGEDELEFLRGQRVL